jgi:3-carboxy-cis,cis-muconate cycloisomerase
MFDALSTTPEVLAATGSTAWVQAMLDVEAALARVGAATGRVPPGAAAAIVAACRADRFYVEDLGRRAMADATPVPALVADLRAALPASAREHVHSGATSQDIVDTAAMLVTRRTLATINADLAAVADRLAALADTHRYTVQIGRTLLQQATPTTFGLVAAGWLVAMDEARIRLSTVDRYRLAVQYGGPVGALAGFGAHAPAVLAALAADLDLAEPVLPWHTDRGRIGELAAALGGVAGALGKVAGDIALLAMPEIGEVAEGEAGASSAMQHKRNPAAAVLVTACAHRAPGMVATLLAAAPQELQRAAGRWQAEWATLTDLLRVVGGAAGHAQRMLRGLRVDPDRMHANARAACGGADPDPAATMDAAATDALIARALSAHAARRP